MKLNTMKLNDATKSVISATMEFGLPSAPESEKAAVAEFARVLISETADEANADVLRRLKAEYGHQIVHEVSMAALEDIYSDNLSVQLEESGLSMADVRFDDHRVHVCVWSCLTMPEVGGLKKGADKLFAERIQERALTDIGTVLASGKEIEKREYDSFWNYRHMAPLRQAICMALQAGMSSPEFRAHGYEQFTGTIRDFASYIGDTMTPAAVKTTFFDRLLLEHAGVVVMADANFPYLARLTRGCMEDLVPVWGASQVELLRDHVSDFIETALDEAKQGIDAKEVRLNNMRSLEKLFADDVATEIRIRKPKQGMSVG